MKLIGSNTEDKFREIFLKSHNSLFNDSSKKELIKMIIEHYPCMKTAYFIEHIPEQSEDHYTILINDDTIAFFEVERFNNNKPISFPSMTVDEYKNGLNKIDQIKLAVALDLAKKDLKK